MFAQQQKSLFHEYRSKYQPKSPSILLEPVLQGVLIPANVDPQISKIFPKTIQKGVNAVTFKVGQPHNNIIGALRVGCVLSGGQAAGGHNVIVGIYDYIKRIHKNSQLFGFRNGPKGIYTGDYIQINQTHISYFKNRGGFDMICSGRDKIQTQQQFQKCLQYSQSLKLDGLVVIGGDDSNTNAALLAEYFLLKGSNVRVVGCPKTIDGDLKNQFVQVSFGFDTACKTYSECIGSIMADTLSSKKYYHFIRLMGRSASHIALQCSLLTRPTYVFIGEQVQFKGQTLQQLVTQLVEIIIHRSQHNMNYGVVLIPQGLIQFIPQMNVLITQINNIVAAFKQPTNELQNMVKEKLTESSRQVFEFLPKDIANQLLLDRDPHGNVQVAKIETEKFIIDLVKQQINKRNQEFKGKFAPLANYFGYEGRCAFPTTFDCDYCYSLGLNAGAIIEAGLTGLMSCIRNLSNQPQNWLPGGYPLITMMNIQHRKNKHVPVIKKALVQTDGPLFKLYDSKRKEWAQGDYFNLVASTQYEFTQAKPFLAVTPTEADLFFDQAVSQNVYDSTNTPFAIILNKNLNKLAKSVSKQKIQYPQILSQTPRIILSEQLQFRSKQLKLAVQRQYPFLARQTNHIATFKSNFKNNNGDNRIQDEPGRKYRIGVSFNGRQSPGGHNIILGLLGQNVEVFGFIGGNKGIFANKYILITNELMSNYINQTGFHFLGRSSDKIRTQQQLQLTRTTCQALHLDGLVLIGATHTLTDTTLLADYLLKNNCHTVVNAVPCTIDNNIHHNDLQVSVGYATSSHTYSTLISNLMIDASSNTKYWYFIKLMGRDPSHLTLECALSTHPNYTIISEQVKAKGWDLQDIVQDIVRLVIKRQQSGRNFGCILIPEGLPTFLPSFIRIKTQLDEINSTNQTIVQEKMSAWAREKFNNLPDFIRSELFCRDDSNDLALSQIETEKLLGFMVGQRLKQYKKQGKYKGIYQHYIGSYSYVYHFLGYQGRCAMPSKFDRNIAFTYGRIAKLLVQNRLTGYCTAARGLSRPPTEWFPLAIPISHMLEIKDKSKYGINKPIVESDNVHLKDASFRAFVQNRERWQLFDHYSNPGPIQHFGPMSNYVPLTITLEENYDFKVIEEIKHYLNELKNKSKFGSDPLRLKIIHDYLGTLLKTIYLMQEAREQ